MVMVVNGMSAMGPEARCQHETSQSRGQHLLEALSRVLDELADVVSTVCHFLQSSGSIA